MRSIRYRTPFDWSTLAGWLRARAIAGVEQVDDESYARGGVVVRYDGETLRVQGTKDDAARARQLFDTDADPAAIAAVLGRDRLLRPLLRRRPGIRVPGAWDPFELAVRAVVGQQVSVAAARTILGRIASTHGIVAERLAEVTLEGMPRRRAETVRTIARNAGLLVPRESLDETIRALTSLPGIGPWTAHYIAMRALGERDAFPAGDLILRRHAGDVTERELLRMADAWRPYRAYAAMLLWTSR